jgi:hypothetical protein
MRRSSAHYKKPASILYLAELLDQISPDLGYGEWVRVLMAVSHETGGSEEGFQLVDAWSSGGKAYPGTGKLRQQWNYIDPDHEPPVTVGTLIWMAKRSH